MFCTEAGSNLLCRATVWYPTNGTKVPKSSGEALLRKQSPINAQTIPNCLYDSTGRPNVSSVEHALDETQELRAVVV
jgi:hypothetical protein